MSGERENVNRYVRRPELWLEMETKEGVGENRWKEKERYLLYGSILAYNITLLINYNISLLYPSIISI